MKSITINNFRCYGSKTIEFRPGINLLLGDNSCGKTSLVRACNFVINSFFCGYSDENTTWKSVEKADFKCDVDQNGTILPEEPIVISFHLAESDLAPITLKDGERYVFDYNSDLCIEKKSRKNSRNLLVGLSPLKKYASLLYTNSHFLCGDSIVQQNELPLYACFTTEDIHVSRKIDRRKFKEYDQKPSFGYFECYDCRGLFDYWIERMLVLQEANLGELEIQCVRNAVRDCLGSNGCNIIDDLFVRPVKKKVYFKYVDGRVVESSLLSDGYKRLINIVVDIAIRSVLLNKTLYGVESYKHTYGTVIIDEIDEHLHPALQSTIMQALHATFPRIQFIVSTHAPLVMSSVKSSVENVVYRLWYDGERSIYCHEEEKTYGLDANLILEEKMLVKSRNSEVDDKLKKIKEFVSTRDMVNANRLLAELEHVTDPNQPSLVRIRAIINRIESRVS